MPVTVSTAVPDAATRAAIDALAALVGVEDGAAPLSDQAHTRLDSADVTHVVVLDGDAVVGYGQRDAGVLEAVADLAALDMVLDAAVVPGVQVWSHGLRSRLITPLHEREFVRTRELHQLRRPLDDAHRLPPDPPLAPGVTIRAFRPGGDDAAWLSVNAAAFAHHPEQGRWDSRDLHARIAEPWFDATGFLLAERAGELLGFHWTKIHPDGSGEVYVLGVAPAGQGLRLGSALLLRGLHHLAERGCPQVLLYVDGDNLAALRLYERIGFTPYDLDIQWRAP